MEPVSAAVPTRDVPKDQRLGLRKVCQSDLQAAIDVYLMAAPLCIQPNGSTLLDTASVTAGHTRQ